MIRNSIFAENRDPCLVVQFFGGCFFGRERQSGEHTYNGLVGIDRVASQAIGLTKVHAATVARNQDTLWQKKMLENIFGMAAIVSRGNPWENIHSKAEYRNLVTVSQDSRRKNAIYYSSSSSGP